MSGASERAAVLVTGGAGYIGSHVVYALLDSGHRPVVLDDLSAGRREFVAAEAAFVEGDVGDRALVGRLIREHGIEAVIHLAGSTVVPESVARPLPYYDNNVVRAWSLIAASAEHGVGRFLFSSTAAVYGEPPKTPIGEDCTPAPVNPYGRSKLACEWMLADAAAATGMRAAALRYFNVAGADADGRAGQVSPRATHLIKVACEAAVGRGAPSCSRP